MRIGIFGFGAVGVTLFSQLDGYSDLYVLSPLNRYEKLKKEVIVNDIKYKPNVTTNGLMDLIIVCVKNYDLDEAIIDLKPFIKKETIILPLLNGITARAKLQEAFPLNNVLYGLVFTESNKNDNVVKTSNIINLCFGEKNNIIVKDYLLEIKKIFDKYRIKNEIPENMEAKCWTKWMLNLGINQVSALMNASYNDMTHPLLKELLFDIFDEVYLVSKAYNVGLKEEDIESMHERVNAFNSDRVTSLTLDFNKGGKNELDIFGPTLIKLAKDKKINVPVNETIYRLIKYYDDKNKRERAIQ